MYLPIFQDNKNCEEHYFQIYFGSRQKYSDDAQY